MDIRDLGTQSDPARLAEYVASLSKEHDMESMHGATDVIETRREAEHQGHRIEIVTSYHIQVDGRTVHEHLFLDNGGRLQCHSLPNYMFVSAVDMVKSLIEAFPEDYPDPYAPEDGSAGPDAGHSTHHEAAAPPNSEERPHDHMHDSGEG